MSEIKQIQNEDFRKPLLLLKKGDKIRTKSGKIYTQKYSFEQRARQIKNLSNLTEKDISNLTDALKQFLRDEGRVKDKMKDEQSDLKEAVRQSTIGESGYEFEEETPEIKKIKNKPVGLVRAELRKRIVRDQEEQEVEDVMDEMLDIVAITETRPQGLFEEEEKDMKVDSRQEPTFDFSLGKEKQKRLLKRSAMSPEEPVQQKYESEKMDDNDRFSDNFFRGVNSYNSFIPNPIVPERQRNMSIRSEILQESRNMRNDPDLLVQPPQSIIEQNRILEGPDDVMPESEVEPQNPERLNYEMAVAPNNIHSLQQNIQDRNARNVRIAQRRILGEEPDYDEFGEDLEFEMKEEQEEKYDPYLLVRENQTRDESFLNNRERLDNQIEELSLASQSRRVNTRGKQAHYQREAMSRLKAQDKMSQMNLDALRKKEINWKRPTRTQAGNSVGLIRQSNRSMALLANQLLP